MHPIAIKTSLLDIHWYGIMMALAFLVSLVICIYLGRRIGRDAGFISDLITWIMISGIIGARLAYVLANFKQYSADPITILYIHKGGLVYYGGFVGAAIGVILFARSRGESLLKLCDVVCVGLPLSHALGRVGCYLNGCCVGKPTGWVGLPVHPVQLYEAGLNAALFLGLLWYYHRKKRDGSVAATYLLSYATIRFSIEFLRGDERLMLGALTLAQVSSLVMFAGGVAGWIWLLNRERTNPCCAAGCGERTH
ncbi:MAG: prolipoprotein diacylglyceryl transferase [bacterium]